MNQSQTKRKHQQKLINEIKKNTQKKDVRETESKNPTWGVVDETEIDRYIEFFPFSEQGVGFRGKNGKKLIEFSLVATNWIGLVSVRIASIVGNAEDKEGKDKSYTFLNVI